MTDIHKETVTTRLVTVNLTRVEAEELLRQHASNLTGEAVTASAQCKVTFNWNEREDCLTGVTVVLTTTTRSEDE